MRRNPPSSFLPRLMDMDIDRPDIYGSDPRYLSQRPGPHRRQQLFSQLAHTNVSLVQAFCVPFLPTLQPLSEESVRKHSLVFSGIPCPPKSIKSVALQRKFYFQAVYHIFDTCGLPAYVQSCFAMGRAHFVNYLGYETRLVKVILDNSHDADFIVQQFARLKKSNNFGSVLNGVSVRHSLPESERFQKSSRRPPTEPSAGKTLNVDSRPTTPMEFTQVAVENITPALTLSPVTSISFSAATANEPRGEELVSSRKVGDCVNTLTIQSSSTSVEAEGKSIDATPMRRPSRSRTRRARPPSPRPSPNNCESMPVVTPLVINAKKGKITKRRHRSAGAEHSPAVTITSLKKSLISSVTKPKMKQARMDSNVSNGNQVNQKVSATKVS